MGSGGFESFWLNFGEGVELKLNSKIVLQFVKQPLFVCVWNEFEKCLRNEAGGAIMKDRIFRADVCAYEYIF